MYFIFITFTSSAIENMSRPATISLPINKNPINKNPRDNFMDMCCAYNTFVAMRNGEFKTDAYGGILTPRPWLL